MPRALWTFLLSALVVGPALAQLPPGLPVTANRFAALHPFGSSGLVDPRHSAMGGAHVADDRTAWHGNPAGLTSLERPAVEAAWAYLPFSILPDIHRWTLGGAYLQPNGDVWKLLLADSSANGATTVLGRPGTLEARETDLSLEWARRVGPNLAIGLGTAYLNPKVEFFLPQIGSVTRLSAHPLLPGGRAGFIYRAGQDLSVGATYDNYIERVAQSVPAIPSFPTVSETYHSTGWVFGAAWWPREGTTVLLDFQEKYLNGGGHRVPLRDWKLGGEQVIGKWQVRVGTCDGRWAGGFGYRCGPWDVSYAMTDQGKEDLPGMGAGTMHMLLVRTAL